VFPVAILWEVIGRRSWVGRDRSGTGSWVWEAFGPTGETLTGPQHPAEHREQQRDEAARQLPNVFGRISGKQWIIHGLLFGVAGWCIGVPALNREDATGSKELDAAGVKGLLPDTDRPPRISQTFVGARQ